MMHKLKVRANHTVYIIFAVLSLFLTACQSATIDARRDVILKSDAQLRREDVADYMTYLRLKKGAGALDQDYILLSYRVIGEMARSDRFANKPERVKIALRDVLNYNPSGKINPAVVHEAIEHELMNTRAMWVVDGSVRYDYVLDVELAEIPLKNDDSAENKALSVDFILSNPQGEQVAEWFDFLKREKGGESWF